MNRTPNRSYRTLPRWAATAFLWLAAAGSPLFAQPPAVPPPLNYTANTDPALGKTDGNVVQAGCSTCSKGLAPDLSVLPTFNGGGCSSCGDGCGGTCYPGRKPCDCCIDESTCTGRLLGGIYKCICCPDPCYEPRWNALADAAFFQDGPRPVTQMRLRFEDVWDYPFPDKAEYLWARADGKGKGPTPPAGTGESAVSYKQLSLYNEVALGAFSTSISVPYLQMEDNTLGGASGFGDLTIGTKSLLLDCELLQFAFVFNTIVPVGNFTKGLGTGHVSLEPGLESALKINQATYVQGAMLYWIPVGGDTTYEGPVLQYHFSLNHLLWNCGKNIQLIGVAEMNGYEICGGAYTDPVTGAPLSAKTVGSIVNIGPGVRLVICDKIDFGVGSAFNITKDSMGDEAVRVDFRWRF